MSAPPRRDRAVSRERKNHKLNLDERNKKKKFQLRIEQRHPHVRQVEFLLDQAV